MHFLHRARRATKSELVDWFGRHVISSLKRLYDAAMIHMVGQSWIPRPLRHSFAAAKIIAVEAKVGKWKAVLSQAILNTWFASKSYVLVPSLPSSKQLDDARRLGIGVCSLCEEGVQEIRSRSTRLPKSYASWMLNDLAWRSSQEARRRETP
jgi:hypothetical protein